MKKHSLIVASLAATLAFTGCENNTNQMENELKAFIKQHEAIIKPLNREAGIAYWDASISGSEEDYAFAEETQLKLSQIFTNKADFEKLRTIKESGAVTDPLLLRQLDILYNDYLSQQIDIEKLEKRIKMESEIEKKFSTFRADVNGNELTDNQVEQILKTSTSTSEVKAAWMAHKNIGPLVAPKVVELVKLRNDIARELGFKNYQEMSLRLNDQDPAEIDQLFDELDNLTRNAFTQLKGEIDTYLANRFKITKDELMPWHYQNRYFQEAPAIYTTDLDKYYTNQHLETVTEKFYTSINLPVNDLIEASDLYEKPGKNQHAYCTDIDKSGDVRVLCNIQPNSMWMNTMLHEYGHAVYDKFNNLSLPYTLRQPAHIFTTEAIAMMFGRFASNPQWLNDMHIIRGEEAQKIAIDCKNTLRLEQLVFSRWVQVMYRFEKAMYANPDQDLNKLWWTLVEKYQLIKQPQDRPDAADWASKIHVATVPCYYHNYMLGELLASQLYHHITTQVLKLNENENPSFVGKTEVGEYLTKNVFMPGAQYYWNDMIEQATDEKLTAKYYANQFVN